MGFWFLGPLRLRLPRPFSSGRGGGRGGALAFGGFGFVGAGAWGSGPADKAAEEEPSGG